MRFGAAFWVQRTGWRELRDACLEVERAGWDSIWIDDHLIADEGDWHDAKLEGWATLAAVAAVTRRVRLGLLVSAHSLRNVGLTAKQATTLDAISGGRAILGIGAGWFEREHEAFGFDFASGFGERLDRLAEALPLFRRLFDGERVTFDGRYHQLRDAICEPRPIQTHLPILVGGSGRERLADGGPSRGPLERLRRHGQDRADDRSPAYELRGGRATVRESRAHRHAGWGPP